MIMLAGIAGALCHRTAERPAREESPGDAAAAAAPQYAVAAHAPASPEAVLGERLAQASSDLRRVKNHKGLSGLLLLVLRAKIDGVDDRESARLCRIAKELWEKRKLDDAVEGHQRAIAEDPRNSTAWNHLSFHVLKDRSEALARDAADLEAEAKKLPRADPLHRQTATIVSDLRGEAERLGSEGKKIAEFIGREMQDPSFPDFKKKQKRR